MNSRSRKILFAAIVGFILGWGVMWAAQTFGGGLVGPTSNPRVIGPRFDAVAPKSSTLTPEQMIQRGGVSRTMDEINWQSSKPTKPDTGPVFRDFNRLTDQHDKFRDNMFEWRAQGRELRQKYDDPQGFRTN